MITGIIVTLLILWLLWTIIEWSFGILFLGINRISKGNKKPETDLDEKRTIPINIDHQLFSPGYTQVLKSFVKELDNVYIRILSDTNIAAKLNGTGQLNSTFNDFVSNAIIFDLVQTYKMLFTGNMTDIRIESSGLAIIASSLMTNSPYYTEKTDFNLNVAHQHGELFYIAKQLLDNAEAEGNPIKIGIVSKYQNGNNFAFPVFLCATDNPLLDEYVTMLHRFATIITQADFIKYLYREQDEVLNEIYNMSAILRRNRDN